MSSGNDCFDHESDSSCETCRAKAKKATMKTKGPRLPRQTKKNEGIERLTVTHTQSIIVDGKNSVIQSTLEMCKETRQVKKKAPAPPKQAKDNHIVLDRNNYISICKDKVFLRSTEYTPISRSYGKTRSLNEAVALCMQEYISRQ